MTDKDNSYDHNYEIDVENVVGSGDLPIEIDIDALAEGFEEELSYPAYSSEEERDEAPEEEKKDGYVWQSEGDQPGLYYEVDGGDGAQVTFHQSGSYISRADEEEKLWNQNEKIINELNEMGVLDGENAEDIEFSVQNIVASIDFDIEIRLKLIYNDLAKHAQYEPEQYPGLQYSHPNYDSMFMVYSNGRVVSLGGNKMENIREDTRKFYEKLREIIEFTDSL